MPLALIGGLVVLLLAFVAAGLLATLIVKLTTTVGQYITKKIREWKKKITVISMKRVIQEMVDKQKEEMEKHTITENDFITCEVDEAGKVNENSLNILQEKQPDPKIHDLMEKHDGVLLVCPV